MCFRCTWKAESFLHNNSTTAVLENGIDKQELTGDTRHVNNAVTLCNFNSFKFKKVKHSSMAKVLTHCTEWIYSVKVKYHV